MGKQFYLNDMDCSGTQLAVYTGWDGDVSLSIWDDKNENGNLHNIRIGMGPNSGDPNDNIEDVKFIKRALRSLAMEFQYHYGEISEEKIKKYREETYKNL